MKKPWPRVKLGEVLRQRKEFITIDDLKTYRRPRVKLHAQGLVLRDEVPGALIKTKKQQVCIAGEFLVAEIDAKVGGFGMVPSELDGAIVSSHYFLFVLDQQRLSREFLGWYVKTPAFRDQVDAQGSTNYAAIRPADVLSYELPLPPLAEQQRIVGRIEELAAKVKEASSLREAAERETEVVADRAVVTAVTDGRGSGWPIVALAEVLLEASYGTSVKTSDDESGVPVLRMGNIQAGRITLSSLKYLPTGLLDSSWSLLRAGDIVINRTNSAELVGKCAVFDFEGAYTFASYLIRLRLRPDQAEPSFVARYINSSAGRKFILKETRQMTGQANISASRLRELPIPLPDLPEQRRILTYLEAVRARVDSLKRLQSQTAAELAALMPAILDRAFRGDL